MAKFATPARKQPATRDLFAEAASPRPALKRSEAPRNGDGGTYTAHDIEVLESLEPVRRLPGMYIGGTDEKALHHLFAEVIDNAMDEASKSALEVVMCTLHAGGKFDSNVYETSGGLHGVGVSVVNALSERLEVEVALAGQLYRQVFARGIPKSGLEKLGRTPNRRGTKVRFKPDAEIFGGNAKFNPQRLFKMARAKAYLFGGGEIRWRCDKALLHGIEGVPEDETFPLVSPRT
jgi:topoisomerase-4 subunit B